tara:strand:+ start:469 stop:729 length:261 start_codon:yes stop_codon:yes gene_type:complete
MQELLFALSSPGTMSASQWLVLAIGSFIVLGSLYLTLKLIKLIKGIGKTIYTPNIGISRHPYQGQPVAKSNNRDGAGSSENQSANN